MPAVVSPPPPRPSHPSFWREGSGATLVSATNYISDSDAAVVVSEEEYDDDDDDDNHNQQQKHLPHNINSKYLPDAKGILHRTSSLEETRKSHHRRRRQRDTHSHTSQRPSPPGFYSPSSSPSSSFRTRRKSSSRSDWMTIDPNEPDWDSTVRVVSRDDDEDQNLRSALPLQHERTSSSSSPTSSLPFLFFCGTSAADCSPRTRPLNRKQMTRELSAATRKLSKRRQKALADFDPTWNHRYYNNSSIATSNSRAVVVPPFSSRTLFDGASTKENAPPSKTSNNKLSLRSSLSDVASHGPIPADIPWSVSPLSPFTAEAVTRQAILELQEELTELKKSVVATEIDEVTTECGDDENKTRATDDTVAPDTKKVRFAEPLVTQLQFRPRTLRDEISQLFFQEDELEEFELDRETTLQDRFECVVVESAPTHYHVAVKHKAARRRRGGAYREEEDDEESLASSKASSRASKKMTRFLI